MKNISIIILFILSASATCQTLDSMKLLLKDHPGIKALENSSRIYLAGIDAARSWPDPEISTAWFALPVETRLGAQIIRVGASQRIPWGGELDNQETILNNRAIIPRMQASARLSQLEYQLEVAWNQIVATREKLTLIEQEEKWLKTQVDLIRNRISQGLSKVDELFLTELKLNELGEKRISARTVVEIQVRKINGLLSRPGDNPVETNEEISASEWPYSETPEFDAHPDLRVWDQRKQVASLSAENIKWQRRPKLRAGLDYIVVGQRDDADPANNGRDILAPMLGISLPISAKKYDGMIEEEEWKMASYESQKEESRLELQTMWLVNQELYLEAKAALSELENQVTWAEKSLPILISSWQEGDIRIDEILSMNQRIWQLKQKMVDKKYNMAAAIAKAHSLMTKFNNDAIFQDK